LIHHIVRSGSETPAGEKPPVLLVMHGYGADEHDLLPTATELDPRFLVLSLRAPIPLDWGGFAWYHLRQTPGGILPDDLSRHETERLLVGSMKAIIEEAGGDLGRVVLLGFSQGAAMVYSLLTSHKLSDYGITVRGAIAMSGYIPRDILGEIAVRDFGPIPFFLSHGDFDDLIPPIAMEEAQRLLIARNTSVESHRYPIGHGISPETLADLKRWVAEKRLAE
jgi:phospholipase/carboxylesterase